MNIKDTDPSGGCHVVILGAGASIAATIRDPKEEIAASLREAFKELKLIQEGKAEGRAVEELFNELQD